MRKYFLEIIVFIGGAGVMIFELTGAKILAPYMGGSIFVWTGLIGVILAFLSTGYWWGGKFADQKNDYKNFSLILFISAVFIGLPAFFKIPLLNFLQQAGDIRTEVILASIILFGPASLFLGAISPYAARLKMINVDDSGKTVGRLYAISTTGSIFGTFLTGFVLTAYLGNTKILLLLSILMFLSSLLACQKKWSKTKIGIIALLFFFMFTVKYFDKLLLPKDLIYIDSRYSDIMLFKKNDLYTKRPVLYLATDFGTVQSGIFLDKDDDFVFPYSKFFRLARYFNPDIKKSLMIGGAAYTFPRDYLKKNEGAEIDVVELDPKMTETAEKYFNLKPDPRLAVYHEDGRVFLNKNQNKYDAIFVDAFKSYFIPFQLTTQEAVEKIYNSLNDNGVVMVNIISSIEGEKGEFFRAEYATYKKIFPKVYVFTVQFPNENTPQNLILAAMKSDKEISLSSQNSELNFYLSRVWNKKVSDDIPILTDDFAPVDNYMMKTFGRI